MYRQGMNGLKTKSCVVSPNALGLMAVLV